MLLDRVIVGLLAFALAFFPAITSAQSPITAFPPGAFSNRAALSPSVGYKGPGDIVSGASAWYSCARAYNASWAASGTNKACDVVDTSTGLITCTYHIKTTGFVDPTECNGAGQSCQTACSVSKMYDQTGNANDASNATLANMATVGFSSLGGLPGVVFTGGANNFYDGATNLTISQPISESGVFKTNASVGAAISGSGTDTSMVNIGGSASANTVRLFAGTAVTETASNASFHSVNAVANGASSTMNVDGSDFTGLSAGTNTFSANKPRIGRTGVGGNTLTGTVMEVGIWPLGFTAQNSSDISTNQHSLAYGYNF